MLFRASFVLFVVVFLSVRAQPPPQGPPPPFLQGASPSKLGEFQEVLSTSGKLTDDQIDAKVKEWIGKQSSDIQSKFADFEKEKVAAKAQGEAAHDAAAKKFGDKAKEADEKLSAIAKDPSLPAQAKAEKINDIVKALDPKVRDELEGAMNKP